MRVLSALLPFAFLGSAFAAGAATGDKADAKAVKDVNADVTVSFPDIESPLGVTVVNGHVTRVDVNVENHETSPISVELIGGALWNSDHSRIINNLTAAKVGASIEPEKNSRVAYSFIVDVQPQDVILELGLVMTVKGNVITKTAYNGTVSIAEPETSLLDPQL